MWSKLVPLVLVAGLAGDVPPLHAESAPPAPPPGASVPRPEADGAPPATPRETPAPPAARPRAARSAAEPFAGQHAIAPSSWAFPVWPKGCALLPAPEKRLACLEFVVEDWPRLGRYEAANAQLGPAKKGEKRVVFFGDSITDGWSNANAGGFFPGKPYVNRGIGGQTTEQMLGRFRADVIELGPKVVVILAGTNDIAGNAGRVSQLAIQNNLAVMSELARFHKVKVVLASLLPVTNEKRRPDGTPIVRTDERPMETIRALNAWMRSWAKTYGDVYLDYHGAMSNAQGMLRPELTDDGLHPNAAGYAIMAPLAERAIAVAMKR